MTVFCNMLCFVLLFFNHVFQIVNTVILMIEAVINGRCHLAAGLITAAGAIDLPGFRIELLHIREYPVEFILRRLFDPAL